MLRTVNMNADIARHSKPGVACTAAVTLWAEVPEFQHRLPDCTWAVDQGVLDVVLLLTWCAAALWFASRATRRLSAD